jgi:hypothetical protein
MGVSFHVQQTEIAIPRGATLEASSIQNIVARIPGTDAEAAILLDGHYDTRAMTPGASDCASAVAVLLETVRALGESPRLKNDLILLFTDNEEYGGALGAAAFVESHPWANEVQMAINFEGLGSTGPSLLFETGPDSRTLVRTWGRISAVPVGQSWFPEIYSRTPISTDLNRFSDAGIPGLNFAHWAKSTAYHTALDNPETIDPRSLQQTGSYALALVRHYGNEDSIELEGVGNSVYFTLFRGLLINYPTSWAIPFSVLAALVILGAMVVGIRRGRISIPGFLRGLAASFISVVVSAGGATGLWMGIVGLRSEYQVMFTFRGMMYDTPLYVVAFALLASAVTVAFFLLFRRKTTLLDLTFGAVMFWWILSIATSVLFPGFSYLFTWPTIFVAFAIGWVVTKPVPVGDSSTLIILAIGTIPGVVLTAPAIYVMYHFAPAAMIGVIVFMVALVMGLLLPVWESMTQRIRWWLPIATASLCICLISIGLLIAGFSESRPRPNAIAYLQNEQNKTASWFSAGSEADDWTKAFYGSDPQPKSVGELYPIESSSEWFPVLSADADYAGLTAPIIEVVSDSTIGETRSVQLNVQTPRSAPVMVVEIEPYNAVQSAIVAGKRFDSIDSSRALWRLTYYAVPSEGFDLILDLDATSPITFQISDRTWDLIPDILQLAGDVPERSADMMAMPNFDYGTVVVTTQTLGTN